MMVVILICAAVIVAFPVMQWRSQLPKQPKRKSLLRLNPRMFL